MAGDGRKRSRSRSRRRSRSRSPLARSRSRSEAEGEDSSSSYDSMSGSDHDGSDQESEAAEDVGLRSFYEKLTRVDDKEVTLTISKESIKLYFETILGKGELDKEGREALRDKYFLSPEQYRKLAPPDLLSTKLHIVKSLDFGGLSGRLGLLHGKIRDVAKVLMKMFESYAGLDSTLKAYTNIAVRGESGHVADEFLFPSIVNYRSDEAVVSLGDYEKNDPEFSQENFDAMLVELKAQKNQMSDAYGLYKRTLNLLLKSNAVAVLGQELYDQSMTWVWDSLQLLGQTDVCLTKARESKYETFLQPGFRQEMQNNAKDPERRREKYSSNQLFSGNLDKEVAEHSKDNKKLSRVVKMSGSAGVTSYPSAPKSSGPKKKRKRKKSKSSSNRGREEKRRSGATDRSRNYSKKGEDAGKPVEHKDRSKADKDADRKGRRH